jgi:hypothetical protein
VTTIAFGAAMRLVTEVRSGGVLANPASITLTILLPDGTDTGPIVPLNDGVGLYHYDHTSTQAGRHVARWVTTAPVGANEQTFEVAPQWGEAGIISLAAAKKQLNIDPDDTSEDEEIADYLRAITVPIERIAGALVRRTVVEKHPGGYAIALNHAPVFELTSVMTTQTGGMDQAVADLDADELGGVVRRKDGAYMSGPVRVTYVSGRAVVPPHIDLAARIILQHMWETQRGSSLPRFGTDEVWDPRFGFSIPRRAQEMLGDQISGIA